MRECDLTHEETHIISNMVERSSSLERLDLSKNRIGDHILAQIGDKTVVVKQCPGLHSLAEAIARNGNLVSIDLSCNGIDGHGSRALARGIGGSSRLQELKLSENPIAGPGAVELAMALRVSSLKRIELRKWSSQEAIAEALQALAQVNTIEHVDVSGSALSARSTSWIGRLVAAPSLNLSSIDISGCGLKEGDLNSLKRHLSRSKSLTSLV